VAFLSTQVALNASTATALWQFGGTSPPPTLQNSGSLQDPIPACLICSAAIYIGGSNVTSANGFELPANTPFPLTFFGGSEILYAVAATGTPTAQLIFGRQ
jgi:hypothetical protein